MESKVAKCDCILEVHDARVCLPAANYNIILIEAYLNIEC